ncbi:MAG: MATE family efflux transporter [Muribaculaceae bacterium]|jgi:putative MATE family efflux protein|nr:MATE family efflux transporter [Muribaculaceae bacterium]
MEDKRLNELAERPVGRLLWEYSLPAVVGMLVMALYNVVDRIFIGQCVGPDAIAGLAICFPMMSLATAMGVLIGVGSTARISIMLGASRLDEAQRIFGNAFVLTIVIGITYMILFMVYLDPMLRLFGASDATLPYARTYMLVLMPGLLLTNITYGFNNIMRASGYPRRAMLTMIIGAVVNVALDPLFILVFDWGIAGASVATVIAMAVSAVFVLAHFFRRNVTLRFKRGIFRLNWRIFIGIISIGAAPAIVNAASCIVNALANHSLLSYGGDRDIGAAGIMVTYTSLLVTIVLGLCQGLQPIIGYNYGAGNMNRLRRAFYLAVVAASVVTCVGGLYGFFWPSTIARVFTTDADLISATDRALGICLAVFPVVGFQIVSTCFFQSIGNATESIIVGLLRQVIFLIPLLIYLPRLFNVEGVWMAFPISDAVATVVTLVLLARQFRDFKAKASPAPPAK